MGTNTVLYKVGQLVRHKRYGYRGVIVEVDPKCLAGEGWYQANQTQPDKNQPWYHVLVSESDQATYPAQTSLIPDESCEEIRNANLHYFFERFDNGRYIRNQHPWPRE